MTDLRKAAEMALEAMERRNSVNYEYKVYLQDAIDVLRQALAQDEQEPVWCGCGDGIVANDEAMCGVCVMRLKDQIERMKAQLDQSPPSKPWASLTDEEIWEWFESNTAITRDGAFRIARAIEVKLKEKNK